MKTGFIQAKNGEFLLNDQSIILKGFAIGSWMNIESFMLRIPGTEKRIRETYAEVYGRENAEKFFDDFLNYFIFKHLDRVLGLCRKYDIYAILEKINGRCQEGRKL